MYLLDMHVHTGRVSACATAMADQIVAAYKLAGYSGIVCTDHINNATFVGLDRASWQRKVNRFMQGYYNLQDAAGDDFDVMLGCEVNLSKPDEPYIPNDYLIYGITKEWLLEAGDLRKCTLKELSEKVREADYLLVQAHPFRYGTIIMDERYLDGLEIFNGNAMHHSHDEMAEIWAERNMLIRTSGSDFHHPDSAIAGGLVTKNRIRNNEDLLKTLRSGKYQTLRRI